MLRCLLFYNLDSNYKKKSRTLLEKNQGQRRTKDEENKKRNWALKKTI
jgi:hypothetical protein